MLKKTLSLSALLALVSVHGIAAPAHYRVNGERIQTPLYLLGSVPVWSEAEKSRMLAAAVDAGTGTINSGDFIPFVVAPKDQAVIDSLNLEGSISGNKAKAAFSDPREYFKEQAVAAQARMTEYMNLSMKGFDVQKDTVAIQTQIDSYKTAYDSYQK